MVKSLWEHFKVLYQNVLERNPTIAAEHSLAQEEEVYKKNTKLTYRNVHTCPAYIGIAVSYLANDTGRYTDSCRNQTTAPA